MFERGGSVPTYPLTGIDFVKAAFEAYKVPYYYGGDGLWPVGKPGFDCENFMRRCLQRTGYLTHSCPDRRAADWANDMDPVEVGQQQAGDVAFYKGESGSIAHVVVVIWPAVEALGGHSFILGANGGGSATKGDDPAARVSIQPATWWKSGFVCYGRVREYAPTDDDGEILVARDLAVVGAGTATQKALAQKYYVVGA